MTGRILVVDDILPNVKLLEVKLMAEYYEVITAFNGFDALKAAEEHNPDLILLDVMMPGMDGFETCQKLKENPITAHIPVVMVTALDQPEDKIKGLSMGADDFLSKPVEDLPLMARVKSLIRLKTMMDELRMRQQTQMKFGMVQKIIPDVLTGNILIVESNPVIAEKMAEKLPRGCIADIETKADNIMTRLATKEYAVAVIGMNVGGVDGLRICSHIRSSEAFRRICLVIAGDENDDAKFMKALDLGVNDFIRRPFDYNEFVARINSQLKRYYYAEQLRKNIDESVESSIIDALTGLYNRRYFNMHLNTLCEKTYENHKSLCVAILDIDFFKSVNDGYGHDIGDEVLVEFSDRIKNSIRGADLGVRLGGEEFVIIMPETDLSQASLVCERIRRIIQEKPFKISHHKGLLDITCSIGMASLDENGETPEHLVKRADAALYRAKQTGRNRVVMHRGKPNPQAQNNVA